MWPQEEEKPTPGWLESFIAFTTQAARGMEVVFTQFMKGEA